MCGVCNFDLIRSEKAKERDKKLLTFVLLHIYVYENESEMDKV